MTLVGKTKAERNRLGLSLTRIAERSDLTRSAVSRIENRWNTNLTVETMLRYAGAVGMTVDFVVPDPGSVDDLELWQSALEIDNARFSHVRPDDVQEGERFQ
jgi:transcriptional regulator with XRE-family HTH domain